jgi:hypothetical protein
MMNELEQTLIGDSAAAPPAHILEGIQTDLAHRVIEGAPHSIYQELWHIAFWQQVSLDWVERWRDALSIFSVRWISRG